MGFLNKILEKKTRMIDAAQDKHTIYFLNSISNALTNSFSSFHDTVNYVSSSLLSMIHVERSYVLLFNDSATKLTLFSCNGMIGDDIDKGMNVSINNYFIKMLREKREYIITPVNGDNKVPELFISQGAEDLLFAPLVFRETLLGLLVLDTKRDKTPFNIDDIAYLENFVSTLAIVIQNARIMEKMRRKEAKLTSIYKIASEMNGKPDLISLLKMILKEGLELIDGRTGALLLYNEETGVFDITASEGIDEEVVRSVHLKYGEGISGWAAKTGHIQRVDDVSADPRYVKSNEEVCSEIAAPLVADGKVIGVLTVDSDEKYRFNGKDEELLSILASQAAIAICSTRMKMRLNK